MRKFQFTEKHKGLGERLGGVENYGEELLKWNAGINLVSRRSVKGFWERHIEDCAQLVQYIPENVENWLDLGTGAGLPGMVIALLKPEVWVHLVESDGRKVQFLKHIARKAEVKVKIYQVRIEKLEVGCLPVMDVVSARALAPLPKLLELSQPFLQKNTIGLFPKGKNWQEELTNAEKTWNMNISVHQSATEKEARILQLEGSIERKTKESTHQT